MTRNTFFVMALLGVALALTPRAATAQNFNGNFPVKIALPPQFANTACLTLVENDNGNGGSATLNGPLVGDEAEYGTFQVVNHLLVATIQSGSDTGEVVYQLFIAPAAGGDLSKGVYEEPGFLSGALTFGPKGGC